MKEVGAGDLGALIDAARRAVTSPARLYLLARTSHLAEGWCDRAPRLVLAGNTDAPLALREAVLAAGTALALGVTWESPATVIPLPAGWEARSRETRPGLAGAGPLEVRHFDPYSVVLRLIARGDEPDYVDALEYLRHGWVEFPRLEALVADVLPRFTSRSLAQDPAEFRRKFRGLWQLHASSAGAPGTLAEAWP